MGKLTEMSTDKYSQNVAQQRLFQKYQSGNYDGGAKTANMINWGITTVFNIANSRASQDGSGDSDSSNINENDDKERKELNKELTKLLKELGLNSEEDVKKYLKSPAEPNPDGSETINFQKLSKAEKISAIYVRLRELNATSSSTDLDIYGSDVTKYDAQQELSDIKEFNTARNAFIASDYTDVEAARKLQQCAKEINNLTVKNAYKTILEPKVNKLLST